MLIGILGVLAVAALAWTGATWLLQRAVLFPRPPASSVSPAASRPGIEILHLGPDAVEAWYYPVTDVGGPVPVLLFAHGNGELIDHWIDLFAPLADRGIAVLLVEYPGYGRSGGTPSQESIARAMEAAYDHAVTRPEVDAARMIAWGRSLGGAAACALAGRRDLAGLVLESTFTSVRPLARRFGIVGPLVRDPFDNLPIVEAYEGPVLVLHGERDAIVPVEHGRALARAAARSELHTLPCGHNDCPFQWNRVAAFLVQEGLLP